VIGLGFAKATCIFALLALTACGQEPVNSGPAPLVVNPSAGTMDYIAEANITVTACTNLIFSSAGFDILLNDGYQAVSALTGTAYLKKGLPIRGGLDFKQQRSRLTFSQSSKHCKIEIVAEYQIDPRVIYRAVGDRLEALGFAEMTLQDSRGRAFQAYVNGEQKIRLYGAVDPSRPEQTMRFELSVARGT